MKGDVEMVRRLLLSGVSGNLCIIEFDETLLHCASKYNRTEIAQLLLTYKADIEARDINYQAPLHVAAKYNSTEVVQLLITHNAVIEARDRYNCTPVDTARSSTVNTEAVIRLLIKHAASASGS